MVTSKLCTRNTNHAWLGYSCNMTQLLRCAGISIWSSPSIRRCRFVMGLNEPQSSSTILLPAILLSESRGTSRGTSNFTLFAGSSAASSLSRLCCVAMQESSCVKHAHTYVVAIILCLHQFLAHAIIKMRVSVHCMNILEDSLIL